MAAPLAALTAAGMAGAKAATALAESMTQLLQPIQALVGPLGVFVDALSPSTMQEFARTMRDLNAVLGVAFQPIVEVATTMARELGSVLLPVTRELAPVIAQFGRVVVQLVTPAFSMMANVMHGMMPVLQLVTDLFAALAPVQQAFSHALSALVRTLSDTFRGLFGGDNLKGAMDGFRQAIQSMAKIVLYASAAIAQTFGATGFVNNLIRSLQGQGAPKESAEGLGAAQSPAFRSFAEYGKTLDLAALIATGGSGEQAKKTEDWLKEAVQELKQISNGQKTASEALGKALEELWLRTIYPMIKRHLPDVVETAATYGAASVEVAEQIRRNPLDYLFRDVPAFYRNLIYGGG